MRRDENGYIVVETIGCFVLFVFLNISILSLINIVAVQARIHYAITQAAETVSMYTYTLDVTGVSDHLVNMAGRGEKVETDVTTLTNNINDVIGAIESLNASEFEDAVNNTYDQVSGFVDHVTDDPMDVLQYVMNYGLNEGKNFLFGEVMRPLVGRYLKNGDISGDEFLKSFHVIGGLDGLQFYALDSVSFDTESNRLETTTQNESALLTSGGDIKIQVQYDIDYTFGALPLPFAKLHVVQEVVTKAWLGGNGDGYVRAGG